MTRLPAILMTLALIVSATALPGCGSDDDEDPAGSAEADTTAAETAPAPDLKMTTGKGPLTFDKKRYEASAGDVTIEFTTDHRVGHNVRVQPADKSCCTKHDMGGTQTVSDGQTSTGTVKLDKGRYTLYCSLGGHWQGGMKATLVVN